LATRGGSRNEGYQSSQAERDGGAAGRPGSKKPLR